MSAGVRPSRGDTTPTGWTSEQERQQQLCEAVDRAVRELRGGDTLVISVELGTSWAEVRDPMDYVAKAGFKGSLAEQINSATDWSIAHSESTGRQQ